MRFVYSSLIHLAICRIMSFKYKKYLTVKNLFFARENKGFSLLEVIFSIGIITVGVVSILTLFNYNLKNEINNKNKLIAIYLAQESIEVVRQVRDNIWFGSIGNGDTKFLDETEFSTRDVTIGLIDNSNNDDIRKGWEIVGSNNDRRKVYLFNDFYVQRKDSGGNWFGWGWIETGFERYLTIENNSGGAGVTGCDIDDCVKIISHVSFDGKEIATVTAYFYDGWY